MIRSTALLSLILMLPSADVGALTFTEGAKWPEGDIPVCWEAPRREHAQERDLIRKAVAGSWERESAVRFSGWRTCAENSDGVRIALETRFPQTRGRGVGLDGKANGMVLPSLWSLAALSINLKAPVHEFGHALGFGHEYARLDAPDPANCSPQADTGGRYIEHDTPLTYFDRDSIMVACIADATVRFSRGTPKLSAADIFGLVGVYGSNPSNILDIDEPGDRFGAALALDDLNEDGTPDLIVAAPGEDDGKGAFYVFTGDELSGFRPWIKRDTADREIKDSIGSAAASTRPGPALLRLIGAASSEKNADASLRRLFPPLDGDEVTVLEHDLDGDGVSDLIVGAPYSTPSGAVIVFRGSSADPETRSLQPWYWFGQSY